MEVMEVLYHEIFQKTSRRKQMFAWASLYGLLFMGLSLWDSLYGPLFICPLRLPFCPAYRSCRALDDSVDLPAARRAYLTRDSEPKPGADFIQLMYILKFAYIYW